MSDRLLRLHWRKVPPSPPSVDGLHPAVLAALALLDADHVRAHVGEDGAAPRRGDEAAVVEHPDPFQNRSTPWSPVVSSGARDGPVCQRFGIPRMRSAIRLRWICEVPAAIVYCSDHRYARDRPRLPSTPSTVRTPPMARSTERPARASSLSSWLELAVAELHRRARRRRHAGGLGLGDAHLGHAPERLDAGVEPADVRAQRRVVPRGAAARPGSAAPARPAARSCERSVMMCCANAVPRSKRSVTLVTRQPSFSSPTRFADRHPHVGEEHLAEVALAVDGPHRPHLDAGLVHVEDQPGDALVLRRVGIGAHEQLAVVGDVGPGAPDLLAVDDVLVARRARPGCAATPGRSRPRARRSPGTRPSRPAGCGAGGRPAARRCPRR